MSLTQIERGATTALTGAKPQSQGRKQRRQACRPDAHPRVRL